MDKYGGWEITSSERINFSQNSTKYDEWMSDEDLKNNTKCSHPLIDGKLAEEYVFAIQEETKHKKVIN